MMPRIALSPVLSAALSQSMGLAGLADLSGWSDLASWSGDVVWPAAGAWPGGCALPEDGVWAAAASPAGAEASRSPIVLALLRGLPSAGVSTAAFVREGGVSLCLSCVSSDLMRCSMASIFFRRAWVAAFPDGACVMSAAPSPASATSNSPRIVAATVSDAIGNRPDMSCRRRRFVFAVMEAPLFRCKYSPETIVDCSSVHSMQA